MRRLSCSSLDGFPAEGFADDAARTGAGAKAGDTVTVILEPGTGRRDIHIPLARKWAPGAGLIAKLQAMSFTHKKEYVQGFTEAKKGATHARRVEEKAKGLLSG